MAVNGFPVVSPKNAKNTGEATPNKTSKPFGRLFLRHPFGFGQGQHGHGSKSKSVSPW